MSQLKDQIKLHLIVLIWGFTSVLGALITLPAIDLVTYRTAIAAAGMALLLKIYGQSFKQTPQDILKLVATGLLVGLHWILFFGGVKAGGASIGVIGISTSTLWAALLAPFFLHRRVAVLEIGLGLVVIAALAYIFHVEHTHVVGLLLSTSAGFVAALFSHINGRITQNIQHHIISFYELLGALLACLLCLPFSALFLGPRSEYVLIPDTKDAVYILILGLACTVYPYAASVELLKRVSVFVTNLTVNLEPVYGILFAALILGEHHWLNRDFYIGATVIVMAVFAYPFAKYVLTFRSKPVI